VLDAVSQRLAAASETSLCHRRSPAAPPSAHPGVLEVWASGNA